MKGKIHETILKSIWKYLKKNTAKQSKRKHKKGYKKINTFIYILSKLYRVNLDDNYITSRDVLPKIISKLTNTTPETRIILPNGKPLLSVYEKISKKNVKKRQL
jgi:hypothetical protein